MTEPRPDGLPQPSAQPAPPAQAARPAASQPRPTESYSQQPAVDQPTAYPQPAYPGQGGGAVFVGATPPSGVPTAGGPLGRPGPRLAKRTTMITLAVIAGVLLIATGLFTTLFVVENGNHHDVVEQIAVKEQQAADSSGELDAANASLTEAEQRKSDLESQNGKLSRCVDAAKEWLNSPQGTTEHDAALDRMFDHCP